jgi:formamidopyrimidine-DNA glycosylase
MELPEAIILSRQMNRELMGKRIAGLEVSNPKCLNISFEEMQKTLVGRSVSSVTVRGKWIVTDLKTHLLFFNPGMGADVLYFAAGTALPKKYQIKIDYAEGSGVTFRIWWFCYLHLVPKGDEESHKMTTQLGPSPLDASFTHAFFTELLAGRRGGIKSFLLNQKNIAGIGNFYIHDILFNAGIHPLRKISSLTSEEISALYQSVQSLLRKSVDLGGSSYEKDFYGNYGGFDAKKHFNVGYKDQCPVCGTAVEKIKTGSTSSYVCPSCQPLE